MNSQFDELRRLVHLEEKRTLHLVDLKEAFLTASAAEKIAEISVQTERLQEEMANITHQLCLLEQAEGQAPNVVAAALRLSGPAHRVPVRRTAIIVIVCPTQQKVVSPLCLCLPLHFLQPPYVTSVIYSRLYC